jgi:hypothetical protein
MCKGVALTRLMWTAAFVAVVAAAVVAGAARADNPPPPLVSVGPTTDPTNTVTASGTASSGKDAGKTDACVNQQHSGTAPPPSNTQKGVQVNDRSCQTSTSTSTAGGAKNGTGSSNGAGSRTVSSSSGSSRADTASAKRSRSASATVAASQALGLLTPHIRYLTAAVQSSRSLRLLVTVRDLRGRLVRDAIVSIRGLPGVEMTNEDEKIAGQVATITSTQATLSNRRGQAGFVVRVPKQSLGKRLLLLVAARTPKANALALGSVRLPGAAKPHA